MSAAKPTEAKKYSDAGRGRIRKDGKYETSATPYSDSSTAWATPWPAPSSERIVDRTGVSAEKSFAQARPCRDNAWANSFHQESKATVKQPQSRQPRFHVLYWDANMGSRKGPTLCDGGGIRDTHRCRWDNMHVCLRMCCREGRGFRRDTAKFVCLSRYQVLSYNLPAYYDWLASVNKKVLSEEVVIGSALEVLNGSVDSKRCGVDAQIFHKRKKDKNDWTSWLAHFTKALRAAADDAGGRCVALFLDEHGKVLGAQDSEEEYSCTPVTEIIIVLGGPDGIEYYDSESMMSIFNQETTGVHAVVWAALQVGKTRGPLHSYIALSGVFLSHDRGELMPLCQDQAPCLERYGNPGISIDARHAQIDLSKQQHDEQHYERLSKALATKIRDEDIASLSINLDAAWPCDKSIRSLLGVVTQHSVPLQILNLRDNCIGDHGVHAIAEFLARGPTASEVLLDGNAITASGAFNLLAAVAANKAYPICSRDTKNRMQERPLWLSMSRNMLNPKTKEDVLRVAEQAAKISRGTYQEVGYVFCVPSGECNQQKCRHGNNGNSPAAHLPKFM